MRDAQYSERDGGAERTFMVSDLVAGRRASADGLDPERGVWVLTSNMAIVPNMDSQVDAFAAGYTQLILDISGYFAP